jgi:hypothetical protein
MQLLNLAQTDVTYFSDAFVAPGEAMEPLPGAIKAGALTMGVSAAKPLSRQLPDSVLIEREALDREDDLYLAFEAHRREDSRARGRKLGEGELLRMLTQMVQSERHLYKTTDSQVSEFLWAELNSLDADNSSDDEEGNEPPSGAARVAGAEGVAAGAADAPAEAAAIEREGAPGGADQSEDDAARAEARAPSLRAEHVAAWPPGESQGELQGGAAQELESRLFAKLADVYNRLVDHCLTLSLLKMRAARREQDKARAASASDGSVRKARVSTAFQGHISDDGTVGEGFSWRQLAACALPRSNPH